MANSPEACRVVPVAQARLQIVDNLPYLDVLVEGQPARFELDTGSSAVILRRAAADRLGLKLQAGLDPMTISLDSRVQLRVTDPASLVLAGQPLGTFPLLVSPAATALDVKPGVDGLIGLQAFEHFDLDVDLPHRRLGLAQPRDCAGGPSPLPGRSVVFRSPVNDIGLLVVPAVVDGRPVSFVVDTGANTTAIDQTHLGLSDADLSADKEVSAYTSGPNQAKLRLHRFASVSVADDVQRDRLLITGRLPAGIEGILGNDFWFRHRLWLSPASRMVAIQFPTPP